MRASDEVAFREYAATRSRGLLRTAYLLCGDWHRAEDVVSTALVKLYAAWPRVGRFDRLDGYTRQIVVRAYLDERRRPWRREHSTEVLPEAAAAFAEPAWDAAQRVDLRRQLDRLPRRQRAVLVLRFYEDMSIEQTAQLLDCSIAAVKALTTRALAAMRDFLELEEAR